MTANELSKKFLLWFQKNNPEARIFRNNVGAVKTKKGMIKFGLCKGSSDFIAFIPHNVLFFDKKENKKYDYEKSKILKVEFYEIKCLKDKMSKDQIKFADMVTSLGGDYFIVHEVNEKLKKEKILHESVKFFIEKWSVK